METAPLSSFAALLAGLEQLDDEQLQVLIGWAQGILLDRVAADHAPPLSVEIVDREEGCILRAYRSLPPPLRSQVLRYVLSPRVRGFVRRGAVYALAGVRAASNAVGAFARGVGRGAAGMMAATGVQHGATTGARQPRSDETSIEVDVPVRTAYDQWTQFETFPQFMEGIEEVRRLDDTHLHWHATIGGKTEEWDAEITERQPDERISWRSTSGAPNGGTVTFDKRGAGRTSVTLNRWYTPQAPLEQAGAVLSVFSSRVDGDLRRFKEFIEGRGSATDVWRGDVEGGTVQDDGADASARGRRTRRTRQASDE